MTFGERLKQIRGVASQEDFAKILGIHKNTLANYEKDARSPDLDFLVKLMEIKPDVSQLWLLTGEGEPSKEAETMLNFEQLENLIVAFTEYLKEESAGYLPPPKLLAQGIISTIKRFRHIQEYEKQDFNWDKNEIKRIIREESR